MIEINLGAEVAVSPMVVEAGAEVAVSPMVAEAGAEVAVGSRNKYTLYDLTFYIEVLQQP